MGIELAVATAISLAKLANDERKGAEARRSSNRRFAQAEVVVNESIDFGKKRLGLWERQFGLNEENVLNTLNAMTPDRVAELGLERHQVAFTKAKENINKRFAGAGIQGSGIAMYINAQAEFDNARTRGQIRTEAEDESFDLRSRFFQIGLGEKARIEGDVNASLGAKANLLAGKSLQESQRADAFEAQGSQSINSLAEAGLGLAGRKFGADEQIRVHEVLDDQDLRTLQRNQNILNGGGHPGG